MDDGDNFFACDVTSHEKNADLGYVKRLLH